MNYEKVQLNGFYVKGKKIVTTNQENKFAETWVEFLKEYSGGQLIAVYTNYESDFMGKFSFIVGIIENSQSKNEYFCGGNYLKFHLNNKNEVFDAWQYIWKSDFNRSYKADFEFYNEDGSVDLCIGIH